MARSSDRATPPPRSLPVLRPFADFALAAAAFAVLGDSSPAKLIEVPLLVNGSFEDGPDLGVATFKAVNEGSRELRGWVVTRGQIDVLGTHWQHAHGNRSLDLHGSPGIGGVQQTFATKKGQKYRLTLSMAGNPGRNSGPTVKTIAVSAAGDEARFHFDTSGRTEKDMGWETHLWDFVAEADETTLEIFSP